MISNGLAHTCVAAGACGRGSGGRTAVLDKRGRAHGGGHGVGARRVRRERHVAAARRQRRVAGGVEAPRLQLAGAEAAAGSIRASAQDFPELDPGAWLADRCGSPDRRERGRTNTTSRTSASPGLAPAGADWPGLAPAATWEGVPTSTRTAWSSSFWRTEWFERPRMVLVPAVSSIDALIASRCTGLAGARAHRRPGRGAPQLGGAVRRAADRDAARHFVRQRRRRTHRPRCRPPTSPASTSPSRPTTSTELRLVPRVRRRAHQVNLWGVLVGLVL